MACNTRYSLKHLLVLFSFFKREPFYIYLSNHCQLLAEPAEDLNPCWLPTQPRRSPSGQRQPLRYVHHPLGKGSFLQTSSHHPLYEGYFGLNHAIFKRQMWSIYQCFR